MCVHLMVLKIQVSICGLGICLAISAVVSINCCSFIFKACYMLNGLSKDLGFVVNTAVAVSLSQLQVFISGAKMSINTYMICIWT